MAPIGKPKREIQVEPLVIPRRRETPEQAPERAPSKPQRKREPVPA